MKLFIYKRDAMMRLDDPLLVSVSKDRKKVEVNGTGRSAVIECVTPEGARLVCAKITEAIRKALQGLGTVTAPTFDRLVVEVDVGEIEGTEQG